MFDTTDQILNQLRAGEDGLAEFKALRLGGRGVLSSNTEDIAGELVAFANAADGAVFLAVDDSGTVAGIPPERLDVGRALDRQRRHAQLRATDSTDSAQGRPPGVHRRGTTCVFGRGTARPLRAPHVRRALLPPRWLHQARPHAPKLARLFPQRGREYVFDEQPVLAGIVVLRRVEPERLARPIPADAHRQCPAGTPRRPRLTSSPLLG